MQPAVGETQVGRCIFERKVVHVAGKHLDLVKPSSVSPGARSAQHPLVEVDREVADTLVRPEPPEGDSATAGHVDDRAAVISASGARQDETLQPVSRQQLRQFLWRRLLRVDDVRLELAQIGEIMVQLLSWPVQRGFVIGALGNP